MVAVVVDARLGGVAKRLGLTRVIDPLDPDPQRSDTGGRGPGFRPMDPNVACREVRAAIALTDAARDPDVARFLVRTGRCRLRGSIRPGASRQGTAEMGRDEEPASVRRSVGPAHG
jgi:hypothetical protein